MAITKLHNRRIDLNLLVSLDILLRERNVTNAANVLGLSQPAMSSGLRRLREFFGDPLLVRTSEGMVPTERALQLQPMVREALATVEKALQPQTAFDATTDNRVFRIMASDYAEAALFPHVLRRLRQDAPEIVLDIMTPSDVSYLDVERGKVDMIINRFDTIPSTFHQKEIWQDNFLCLLSANNKLLADFKLTSYIEARHVWVSKTGFGVGVGINPEDVQRLGWVDEALNRLKKKRHISVFTRHYQAAMLLAEETDLVVTLPSRAALLQEKNPRVVIKKPPFEIPPFELKMVWSPLLQHSPAHRWMRNLVTEVANSVVKEEASTLPR